MLTAAAIVLGYFFLPAPWSWVVVAAAVSIDAIEITIWLRIRRSKSITGPDALIGVRGTTITVCRPEGRVKIQGQIWKAQCPRGADAGEQVVVTGVDELMLSVDPAGDTAPARDSAGGASSG